MGLGVLLNTARVYGCEAAAPAVSDGMQMKTHNEVVDRLNKPLTIVDSTLGEGEKAAGAVFSNIEKYRIAQSLADAGVSQIIVGSPSLGNEDKTAVRHIARMGLDASIMSLNRTEISDIDASIDCDVDAVQITVPSTMLQLQALYGKDIEWALDKVYETVAYAVEHGLYVSLIAEDASRADLSDIIEFAKTAKSCHADRFGYSDSIGVEDPFTCNDRIDMIRKISGIDIGIVARNDFGMATANTIAAVKAGAKFASVTSMGIGQRAGCAPLEEVALAAKQMLGIDTGIDLTKLRTIAESVSSASGIAIWPTKPVIGSKCYAQEAGFIGNYAVTEPYDPAIVGMERQNIIGKHSARNTVAETLKSMNVDIGIDDAENLLGLVRRAATQMHRSLTPSELYLLYEDMMSGIDTFDIESEQ